MVAWIALAISVVSAAAAVGAVIFTRKQVNATETHTWLGQPLVFKVAVTNPSSGSARIVLSYEEGPPLDSVTLEAIDQGTSPLLGFGVGRNDSTTWEIEGTTRVGDTQEKTVVQATEGTGFRPGDARLRATCTRAGRERELILTAVFPHSAGDYFRTP